jgi:hypothetical protein
MEGHPGEGHRSSDLGPRPDHGAQTPETKPDPQNDRCNKLIDRVVTLAVAERPADQKPTDDERANIVKQLHSAWAPKCEAMTNKGYDCAVKAQTLAELDRCGG